MDDLYREHILEHAQHPRNWGELPDATFVMRAANASCGDSLEIFLKIDEAGIIKAVTWQGDGCAVSTAAASLLSEKLVGSSIQKWESMSAEDVLRELELLHISPSRQKCALLFWQGLRSGEDWAVVQGSAEREQQ
ncbi:iron-sulfur cluster assembly scaffold protein [Candidatus Woesebacteria bacterium]|nr:iron-sulfur cluster assembly scaffold protein [Candidatus Woesebacteria bacterium]MCD8506947.1 iron-sulfur cluster assembly scaffold protein [Candidatus Woesebacteria bacterium]MCD8527237.1 iron-sulfur cluster assembly scaffold protein [Candidatus Woesebacteria bacterium]MCD8546603.1 iron-sulfur cluster assembly scaffold protein [Candidatus Woesebacteria bacterium]